MRARLFSTSSERQRTRHPRRGPGRRPFALRPPEAPPQHPEHVPDAAVERAQHAGGPLDAASYTCACGYLFVAPVSTTVSCPHCGAGQAW